MFGIPEPQLDFTNIGDLDIRIGVSEGIDADEPKDSRATENDFLFRKGLEDEYFEEVISVIKDIERQASNFGILAKTNPEAVFKEFGNEAGAKKRMGETATKRLVQLHIMKLEEHIV